MEDWNVVVSTRDGAFNDAAKLLRSFGRVHRTGLYNVLVMKVDKVAEFLDALRERAQNDAEIQSYFGRIVPVTATFAFRNVQNNNFPIQGRLW
ncbi:MAG TPA: hypothetical protein VFE62_03655 [Gemmataceae bacterium]|nr:hypothetical protein [Gemmataceae bacterium]